ncbi:MAG TPA: MBL fold metallo-hydrolase [Solirubrobacterales bacterium]|nr:MBL fold metallo-hydrolase [Solirubrobacterales bacterium]
MENIQRQLSEYLQCELYHLLGAYGVAEEHLDRLTKRLPKDPVAGGSHETSANVLESLVGLSRDFNKLLGWNRYATDPRGRSNQDLPHSAQEDSAPVRELMPAQLVMTKVERFAVGPKDRSMRESRKSLWSTDEEWGRIARYYREAIAALKAHQGIVRTSDDYYRTEDDDHSRQVNFARSLLAPRDSESRTRTPRAAREHLRRRIDRYELRLRQAVKHIGADHDAKQAEVLGGLDIDLEAPRGKEDEKFLRLIMENHPTSGGESLSTFVLRVQAEAHLSMHAVEAWRSMCLGENAEAIGEGEKKWLERELERSIALDTFAFCVSRTAPWIFARTPDEASRVIPDVATAWENLVPLRCMWIASQISLLSLHRRAYARALQEKPASLAYNDYHKLQHLIRDTQRRVEGSPLQVAGARGFLAGLNAEAHHHIGELYRSEHAHKPALEHFEAASHRLEQLRAQDATFDEVLTNSRWYVELQISHGKACYEMGRHKEALCWHLKAWRAFLELLSSETETETNTKDIGAAIDWLENVKFEPELRKSEISERLGPVIEQLDRISPVGRVGSLAAEILLRLGHLLFVLNIGDSGPETREIDTGSDEALRQIDEESEEEASERLKSTLAFACLSKAAECDPYSTLIGTDLLKMRYRFNRQEGERLSKAMDKRLAFPPLRPIDEHWPRGGSDYERIARAAEYLMLKARKERFEDDSAGADSAEVDGLLARDLLLDLFMSTDSINVRKSQIHRFLMAGKAEARLPCNESTPAIEFVCMRRYSSPFPLLPRPSAFRALGGGYFVRLHDPAWQKRAKADGPYGIVVDPGVDFVENLYRTGYSLGDIDMIVITHDHVDHLGALDPLLSLLHVRSQILRKQDKKKKKQPGKRVAILTSGSVAQRYKEVRKLSAPDSKNFFFQNFERLKRSGPDRVLQLPEEIKFPDRFEVLTTSSVKGADKADRAEKRDGHRDLSSRPSHGVCLRRAGDPRMAVAISSDTPPPPPPSATTRREEWERAWGPALEAGIFVVHLGSVPLTELRRMDGFEQEEKLPEEYKDVVVEERDRLIELQEKLQEADRDLRGQVEYAQWLRSHLPDCAPKKEVIAPIVGPVDENWLPPPEHNYLVGLLRWARRYRDSRDGDGAGSGGLFVIGELSEELGTMRGKVAARLNHRIFEAETRRRERERSGSRSDRFPYALTADIGLQACVRPGDDGGARVEVLCTTCNLDTDRTSIESYHPCDDVYEVCVKGENEGIFYNCLEHDPARQDEPAFLEQLERFDIFGR